MQKLRNKKIYAGALVLLCALAVILCLSFGTVEKSASAFSVDDNYSFGHVDVDIEVRKNKTFSIKEKLITNFSESGVNTGIIRDIQRVSRTTRVVDGKKKKGAKYIANLTEVSVLLDGGEALVTRSLYHGGEFHSVKMQTPSGTLSAGTHVFELSYVYDMSDDKAFGYDDFTFDVLGYAMNRTEKFTCTITFPEDADLSRITFRTNEKAEWSPDRAAGESAEVSGNTVNITAFPQAKDKGYTVQVLLPKGYFNAHVTFYKSYLLFAGLTLLAIAAGIIVFLYNVLNRKPKLEVVEYFPPEGLDIMHASAVWHRGARYKDISALILKWAGEGLIEILKDGERHLKIKPTSKINNAKERDAAFEKMTYAERRYFEYLFYSCKQPKTFFTRAFKKSHRTFKRGVYERCDKLVESGNTPEPVKIKAIVFMCLFGFISLIPSVSVMLYFGTFNGGYVFLVLVPFWAVGVFTGMLFHREKVILMLLFPMFFYGLLYGIYVATTAFMIYDYAGLTFIAPVWEVLCSIVAPFFLKGARTKEAQVEYGKLYGFKKFLLMAELPQIQLLFDERPDYFSQIMPYCYIMGVSKKVQKRFAALNCALPPYLERGVNEKILGASMPSSHAGRSFSFAGGAGGGGGSSGGGGGGSGGSSGGGGGGGGSRGC